MWGIPYITPNPPAWLVNTSITLAIAGLIFWVCMEYRNIARINRGTGHTEKSFLPMWRFELIRDDKWPIRRVLPLGKAAQIALNQLQGTTITLAAEKLGTTPIGYMTTALTDQGKTKLWATGRYSTKLTPVPEDEAQKCAISDDGYSMTRWGESNSVYNNLHITRTDLNRRIKELRAL